MAEPDTAAEPGTRERLVFAALQLFAEKGYGSTSVADVRQTAQAHSGSLYHFFPGKQELLLAIEVTVDEKGKPVALGVEDRSRLGRGHRPRTIDGMRGTRHPVAPTSRRVSSQAAGMRCRPSGDRSPPQR